MKDVQLHLACQQCILRRGRRTGCYNIDAARNLGDIVFDEELRAGIRPVVQSGCCYVPKITDETASDEIYEVNDIALFFGRVEGREALVDEAVIVMLARGALSPALYVSS
jgi:hypothetical protein